MSVEVEKFGFLATLVFESIGIWSLVFGLWSFACWHVGCYRSLRVSGKSLQFLQALGLSGSLEPVTLNPRRNNGSFGVLARNLATGISTAFGFFFLT